MEHDKFVEQQEKEWHRINKWEPIWKQMEKDIADLKSKVSDKVDTTFFDDELDRLKNLLN